MKTQLLKHQPGGALCVILLFCTVALSAQTTRYVKPGGTPAAQAKAATTWEAACVDLQAVVDSSSVNDTVFVAKGTYTGGFYLKEGVQVYGGFAGTENSTAQRTDPMGTNRTVLDGGGTQRVLTQPQPFIALTVWNGFVLQNGNALPAVGAIVYNMEGTTPAGVLYSYDASTRTGYMLSLDEVKKRWSGSYTLISGMTNYGDFVSAKTDFSGAGNTAAIVKQLKPGDYAAYWCDTLTAGGFTGWYLPACGELFTVGAQKVLLNKTLAQTGAIQFSNDWYLSGSQKDKFEAWGVNFFGGTAGTTGKPFDDYGVRAVSVFNSSTCFNNLVHAGGGALLLDKGILRNCHVKGNIASDRAGGVYAAPGAQVQGCLVEDNSSPSAPGVYAAGGATIVNSTVVANNQVALPAPLTPPAISNFFYTDGSYSAARVATKELLGVVCSIDSTNSYSGLVLNVAESGSNTWQNQVSWADSLIIGGCTWRLPSLDELQTIGRNKTVLNTALGVASGTILGNNSSYWSGSDFSGNKWYVDFSNGGAALDSKNSNKYSARAVLAF